MIIAIIGVAGSGKTTIGRMLANAMKCPFHFMKADMLASQFDALEEPSDALVVDVSAPPRVIVERVVSQLRIPSHAAVAKH